MANGICDICKKRTASFRAQVMVDGERRTMELCDEDYRQLTRRQSRFASPLESLFGGSSLIDEFFGGQQGSGPQGERGPAPRPDASGPAPRPARRGTSGGINIADRLSEQGGRLLQEAAQKAAEFGRTEVDTEHLLFALTQSDVVATLLGRFKVDADDLRRYVEAEARRGEAEAAQGGEIGVSPRLMDALNRAFVASNELGHSYVGPEHLLIGLAEEGEGLAADVLRKYGLTPQALRQQVTKIVGHGAEDGRVETPSSTPDLDEFSRDLTGLAREGKLDPVIGRAREIETTIEVLARRKKNNPVLIGEPGVGKTAIAEGLAQRIVANEVPEALRGKRLVELNINSMVAGSKYRGEFEERVQKILKEITEHKDELVLFIDEIHTIVGAGQGGGEGGLDIANTFKPALARGELNLIGATTLNEYQKYIEKDAALERRFQPVHVEEPTVAQTVMILRGLRDTLESHHKVTITDEAVVAAAELGDRYVSGRFMPDKAIDLIDQAAARVKIGATARPVDVQELEAEVEQIRREQDYAAARKQFDRAADLKTELEGKQVALDGLLDVWKRDRASASTEVKADHVAQIVSKLTGIPVTDLTSEERQKLLELEDRLHERVIGQDEAIGAVADAVRLSRAGLREGTAPEATFLFLGPTGVGKTELAKALAETVYGDEDAMIRIDMSEYGERHAVARLVGAPPGYVGYDEGGQLTERVRRRPHSVVLLDEIEKAHPDVYNILLQVFDDGRLTDGKGRVVDFTNTIIIATSNLGSDIIQRNLKNRGKTEFDSGAQKTELMGVLRGHFRPEFINRIDEIIVFHSLNRPEIRQIVALHLERVARTALGQGVQLDYDAKVLDHFAAIGFQPEYGARELQRLIRSELKTELARAMLGGAVGEGDRVRVVWSAEDQKIAFEKLETPGDTPDEDPAEHAPGVPSDFEGDRPDAAPG